ncbi:uncharacterized protein LOC132398117 isoform X1 [Hypanus sabinus]|uniref:uncharacterized protein LOC132398117 isoform X1 n=1 Tax=Hypanus sabinus TaxID=79690 RepID=UPI0028C4256F|nr:uncharacterized protein LOC132398117 isoform X1 [Hypanus sabinus]
METVLRPDRLDLDPQDPDAALAFEHWLACFQSYLEEVRATEPAVMHRILLSRVTPKVYSIFRDLPTYDGALDALKRQYLGPVNTVYARHRLATRQQRPGESCAEFLRALQTLVRPCDCKTLTAEQHAELLVRDAFVTGLRSVYMRQRLLENADLTLRSVIETANALEAALHNADAVQSRDSPPVPWTPQTPTLPAPGSEIANAAASRDSTSSPTLTTAVAHQKPVCYFCGHKKHPRQRCPAREATCSSCGKRGHFAKREMDRMVDQYQLQATFPYLDNITICGHDRPDHDANLQRFLQVAAALNLTYNRDKCVLGTTRLAILGKSVTRTTLPVWLTSPGPVLLQKHVRSNKYSPLVERVHLLHANPQYAYVVLPDGREDTVSIRDLAPAGAADHYPEGSPVTMNPAPEVTPYSPGPTQTPHDTCIPGVSYAFIPGASHMREGSPAPSGQEQVQPPSPVQSPMSPASMRSQPVLRRSQRQIRPPDRLDL